MATRPGFRLACIKYHTPNARMHVMPQRQVVDNASQSTNTSMKGIAGFESAHSHGRLSSQVYSPCSCANIACLFRTRGDSPKIEQSVRTGPHAKCTLNTAHALSLRRARCVDAQPAERCECPPSGRIAWLCVRCAGRSGTIMVRSSTNPNPHPPFSKQSSSPLLELRYLPHRLDWP